MVQAAPNRVGINVHKREPAFINGPTEPLIPGFYRQPRGKAGAIINCMLFLFGLFFLQDLEDLIPDDLGFEGLEENGLEAVSARL